MAGFFDLGQSLLGGVDREGARLEGLDAGSRINARRASTEAAMAKAAIDRDIALARRALRERKAEDATNAALFDIMLADMNPEQFTGAQLDQQQLGFRSDLANVALEPEVRQGAALGIRGAPITASDMFGPGGELQIDAFDPTQAPQVTPTGRAQIGFDQARAAESLADAALADEKRTNPAAFRSNTTLFGLGSAPLGDAVLDSGVGPSTINADINPAAATGAVGAGKSLINAMFDVVNADLPFPDTDTAQNALNDLHVRTQIVGQQAVPGRPSNYLMQQLAAFGVTPNNPFKADQRSLNRMMQTEQYLAGEIDNLRRDLNSGLLTKADVSKASRALRGLEGLRRDYEVVISRFEAPQITEAAAVDAPPATAPEGQLAVGETRNGVTRIE